MPHALTAGLIAGGKSSRMGRDKACVEIAGIPLWRRQLDVLAALEPTEILISGRPAAAYAASGLEIVEDEIRDAGPLAGVAAMLARIRTPLLLVLAVDMPFMTSAYLAKMLHKCGGQTGVVPRHDECFEPLAAVFPKAAAPLFEGALANGNHSMQKLVRDCFAARLIEVFHVSASDLPLFKSVNSPSDLPAV